MARNLFSLLIGINDYPSAPLNASVNDVENMQAMLEEDYKHLQVKDHMLVLKDHEACRDNVLKAFREHLSQASSDDTIFIHYSGHGSFEPAPEEFLPYTATGKNQTLVCQNSRTPGNFDLSNKEIAILLHEIAPDPKNAPHLVVCLDACHSGTGTRDAGELTKPRRDSNLGNPRPLETYLDGYYVEQLKKGEELHVPISKHVLLAACQPDQLAWETRALSGLFTSRLLRVLEQHRNNPISYAEAFSKVRTLVRMVGRQEPNFMSFAGFNPNLTFLGEDVSSRPKIYSLYFDASNKFEKNPQKGEWKVKLGAIHGLVLSSPDARELLVKNPEDEKAELGMIHLKKVLFNESKAHIKGLELDTKTEYEVIPQFLLSPPIPISKDPSYGDAPIPETPFMEEAPAGEGIEYSLGKGKAGDFYLRHQASQRVLLQDIYQEETLATAFRMLYNWEKLKKLRNPDSKIRLDKIDVNFTLIGDTDVLLEGQELAFNLNAQKDEDGETTWEHKEYSISLQNNSKKTVYATAFFLMPLRGIMYLNSKELLPEMDTPVLFNMDDEPTGLLGFLDYELDQAVSQIGVKFIFSRKRIDYYWLTQEGLETLEDGSNRFLSKESDTLDDWITYELNLKMVKNLAQVGENDQAIGGSRAILKANAHLKADVALNPISHASKSADPSDFNARFSSFSREYGIESLDLNPEASLAENLLELSGIQGELSPEQSLEIVLKEPLGEKESMTTLSFDGEDLLPVGFIGGQDADQTHIMIEHIPEEQVKSRSLGRALKLAFFKIVNPRFLGSSERIYRLSRVEFLEDAPPGKPAYNLVEHSIAENIKGSQRVLVLVHGLLGNNGNIIDMLCQESQKDLREHYDMIVSFDYEHLNSSIRDDIAQNLKARLEEVGFGPDDKAQLHIMAHGMGGLVARWTIEQLGAHAWVDHLCMVGTPNGGSEIGQLEKFRKFAILGITLAANSAIPGGWLLGNLAGLLAGLSTTKRLLAKSEILTKTLSELQNDSPLIKALNESASPASVPYTIIAGNHFQVESGDSPILKRILEKLNFIGTNITYMKQDSDLMASRVEMLALPEGQDLQVIDVPAHYYNYFDAEKSVSRIKEVLLSAS